MPVMIITHATIEDITAERNTTFVTVTYTNRNGNGRNEQTIRLVVGPRTIILNANGFPVSANMLRRGMTINTAISSAMTRSIPPQSTAYLIRIIGRRR